MDQNEEKSQKENKTENVALLQLEVDNTSRSFSSYITISHRYELCCTYQQTWVREVDYFYPT